MIGRVLLGLGVLVVAGAGLALAQPAQPVVELGPGRHSGFTVDEPTTVRALDGAVVTGEIVVTADRTRLEGVHVWHRGDNGITVRGASGVVLDGVVVEGPRLHGIELIEAQGTIRTCQVHGLSGPFAQGIEVRNAEHLGRSVVEGCTVTAGIEGIVSHVSRLVVRDNTVTGTTMRGISITEMTRAVVEGNRVHDVVGSGIFCGDMSHCEIRDNTITGVSSDGAGIRSRSGSAIVGWYYSTLRVQRNEISAVAGETVDVFHGTVLTDRFPLTADWPLGWEGLRTGMPLAAAALAVLLALRLLVGRGVPQRRETVVWSALALPIAGAWLIQSFHMVEHVAQVLQTYHWQAEHRSGLLGRAFDIEWVHFTYNAAVLGFLVWVVRKHRSRWLLAATLFQSYHMVEHVAKLVQHLRWNIDPAPGLLGGRAGLVWFHFAVNLAVYVGMTIGLAGALRVAYSTVTARSTPARIPPPHDRLLPDFAEPPKETAVVRRVPG